MAKTVVLIDDLDGSNAAESVTFSLKGTAYTIDLSRKNAAALEKLLKPYIAAATKVPARGRPAATPAKRTRRAAAKTVVSGDVAAIRAWAADAGHAVSSRGRISKTVRDAYDAATK